MRGAACAERLELHHHHQVEQTVLAPASQPRHVPIGEARPQRDWCAEAQEPGFYLHRANARVSTFIAPELELSQDG